MTAKQIPSLATPSPASESAAEPSVDPLLEVLLDGPAPQLAEQAPTSALGVRIGVLAGISPSGGLLIDFTGNTNCEPLPARTMIHAGSNDIGREVALLFEGGDPRRPIVMGFVAPVSGNGETAPATARALPAAEVDGERIVFTAEQEIVLRCGQASITLTRAGKILIRGAYLLSRSSGVNRIKGGSVQIN
jgi:hypothetical protein